VPGVWRTSLYGGYGYIDYNANANAMLCASAARTPAAGGVSLAGSNCDFDIAVGNIGSRTVWTPVKGLDLSAELQYSRYNTHLSGTINPNAAPTGFYAAGSVFNLSPQNVVSGQVRIIRVF